MADPTEQGAFDLESWLAGKPQPAKVDASLAKGASSQTVALYSDGDHKVLDEHLPIPKDLPKPETVVQGDVPKSGGSTVRVTFVEDGDTFQFDPQGSTVPNAQKDKKGRFICRIDSIDAPETDHGPGKPGQPGGPAARDALRQLIDQKQVTVKIAEGSGSYGRNICQVELEGKGVDQAMVKNGLAWVVESAKKFTDASRRLTLQRLQDQSMANGTGAFGMSDNMEPFRWRQHYWPKDDQENK